MRWEALASRFSKPRLRSATAIPAANPTSAPMPAPISAFCPVLPRPKAAAAAAPVAAPASAPVPAVWFQRCDCWRMACCSAVSGWPLAPILGFWQAGSSKDSDSSAAAPLSVGLRRARAKRVIGVIFLRSSQSIILLWHRWCEFAAKSLQGIIARHRGNRCGNPTA